MQLPLFSDAAEASAVPITARQVANYIKPVWVGERVANTDTQEPGAVAAYWFRNVTVHPFFDPDKEHLAVLLLNTKLRTFAWNLVSVGSLNEALAHPREVLRPAIAAPAYGIAVMHNHPSGDTTPSDADRRLTNRIKEAGELMQIRLVDHVIVGRSDADRRFSFKEAGLI